MILDFFFLGAFVASWQNKSFETPSIRKHTRALAVGEIVGQPHLPVELSFYDADSSFFPNQKSLFFFWLRRFSIDAALKSQTYNTLVYDGRCKYHTRIKEQNRHCAGRNADIHLWQKLIDE